MNIIEKKITPPYRIAIDVGGTFTDLVIGGNSGRCTYKTSSSPQDPPGALLNGLVLIANDLGVPLGELLANTKSIVHGTTITTNALLTRTGAKTGLITTAGFRDVLSMAQGQRQDQMNSKASRQPPLVPRHLIYEVKERLDRNGQVSQALSIRDILAVCESLTAEGVESIAVAFMFGYLNPSHEREAEAAIKRILPNIFVSLSSQVAPEIGLYERTSTTVLSAYVGPILRKYLQDLGLRLTQAGYSGPVLIMQSNGGVALLEVASENPVNTLLSGPAGCPVAASAIAKIFEIPKAMTIDMGGTSFEVSVSRNGITDRRNVGKLSGVAITAPMLDISTIGAGGGSIAWLSPGGELRVGPRSAGAVPGPACYGRGGVEPTVTDASLLLGYLNPETFGNGQLKLDRAAAARSIGTVAGKLGISVEEAAWNIYDIINAAMTDSLRLATVNKGYDPREFAIIAAGGAGPIHAAHLAHDLGIALVIVPRDASVLCAAGMLDTNFIHYSVRSLVGRNDTPPPDELQTIFEELEESAIGQLVRQGVNPAIISLHRFAELRYHGQIHSLEVGFVPGRITENTRTKLDTTFIDYHRERYGHVLPNAQTEIVNLRLQAIGEVSRPPPLNSSKFDTTIERRDGPLARSAWFGGGFIDVFTIRDNYLRVGEEIIGPALIELPMSTIVVPGSFRLTVTPHAYLIHHADQSLDNILHILCQSGGLS